MTAVERYNALDGQTVKREELQKIAVLGAKQGQTKISLKLFKLLEENDDEEFKVKVAEYALDRVPEDSLNGLDFAYPDEELEGGLEKAVAPDDIYQMITDKLLEQLKKASGNGYKTKWKKQNDAGYLLPFNFDTKKMYRGINIPLLTNGMSQVLKNPFFLTFNQIEKNKGKLKKGSKGFPVVYFTVLYAVKETGKNGENIDYGSYNKKKFLAWLDKNQSKLRFSKDYYKNTYIPILKYYNVFNGADVEGIDFDLDNFKIGYQDGSETVKNNDSRVAIADLIVKNYPNPQPKLFDSKNGKAYYSHNITGSVDEIHMPKFEDFETGLDYYRTLLHEFTHSTGVSKRLGRDMGGKFGSKNYAKEELVAEFGAVFLSAHAGIIWYNQSNHAEYLKNWNNVLTHAKDDNRFIMRAASAAQAAADFILNLDNEGVPAYQNSLKSELAKNPPSEKKKNKKQDALKPSKTKGKTEKKKNAGQNTNDLLAEAKKAKISAKNKAEFEKGIKKLGFEIVEYNSNQTSPKEWERTYKLNFRDITGLTLKMSAKPDGKEIDGDYSWEAIGVDADSFIDYKNLQEFYEEILADFKEVFGKMTLAEAAELKNKYSKTLFGKKEPKTQLGLFGAVPSKPNRKDTISFAKKHLIGKGFFVEALNDEVHFTLPKIKHAINPPSKENLALVYKLPVILSKAVLLSQEPDKKKRKEIKTVFKLVLIENLFGKTVRVLITIRKQDKNLYYDHAVIDTIKPEKQHGSVNQVNPIPLDVASPVPNKDKKKINSKKKGLKSPVENTVATVITEPVTSNGVTPGVPQILPIKENSLSEKAEQTITRPEPKVPETGKAKSLDVAMNERHDNEVFQVPGDLGRFLGQVEKKPVHSVVTTLDAEQGAGKTRFLFQAMNALAGIGLKCLFYSLEEHPASKLFKDKVDQYIDLENLNNISVIDEVENWNDEKAVINKHDAIFIDSFQKLPQIDLDSDIRKSFNGKWFFVIYQQTGTKGMRGGSKAAFDGDQILKVFKDVEDYRNNYIFANKNRYNDSPGLQFNIFSGKLQGEVPAEDLKVIEDPVNSRVPIPESGRLIATPVI